MKLSDRYKYECDTFRLLIEEFENQVNNYYEKNEQYISEMVAHDVDEYLPPKFIPNYKLTLTTFLLIEAQGLLDFFIPIIVNSLARIKNVSVSDFDETWKNGNVLCWVKHVLKEELGLKYDFNQGSYCKLKEFYRIRNDLIHYGGYLSDRNKKLLEGKKGIRVSEISQLYVIEFSYCRDLINDIEEFFSDIHKNF